MSPNVTARHFDQPFALNMWQEEDDILLFHGHHDNHDDPILLQAEDLLLQGDDQSMFVDPHHLPDGMFFLIVDGPGYHQPHEVDHDYPVISEAASFSHLYPEGAKQLIGPTPGPTRDTIDKENNDNTQLENDTTVVEYKNKT